jgi:hypothetical protein
LALSNGAHSFKLTVTDREGRVAVGYVNLTVDSSAPTVSSHSAASISYAEGTKLFFGFSETVDITGMTVKVNGQAASFDLSNGVYEVGTTLTAGTSYLVSVSGAQDAAGNVMEATSWTTAVLADQSVAGKVQVSGTMVDKNGQPVVGAVVTIGGQSVTADALGHFSVYVDPGQLQLHATATGMVEFTQSVNAATDQQLGQLVMTSTADNVSPGGSSSPGSDMTLLLVIGVLVVAGALFAVVLVQKKRKG